MKKIRLLILSFVGLLVLFAGCSSTEELNVASDESGDTATDTNEAVQEELKCFTYSLSEYDNLLREAGFKTVNFHVAIPDYKLPSEILPIRNNGKECYFNEFLVHKKWVTEHDGSNGAELRNQDLLKSHYNSLADMNIAHYFAPSFYIESS